MPGRLGLDQPRARRHDPRARPVRRLSASGRRDTGGTSHCRRAPRAVWELDRPPGDCTAHDLARKDGVPDARRQRPEPSLLRKAVHRRLGRDPVAVARAQPVGRQARRQARAARPARPAARCAAAPRQLEGRHLFPVAHRRGDRAAAPARSGRARLRRVDAGAGQGARAQRRRAAVELRPARRLRRGDRRAGSPSHGLARDDAPCADRRGSDQLVAQLVRSRRRAAARSTCW